MTILNNCTDCGRLPLRSHSGHINNSCYSCACGRTVASNGDMWSVEVAADMWNRANPKLKEHINELADRAAKAGIKPIIRKSKLAFEEFGIEEWLDFTGGHYRNAEHCLLAAELYENKPQLLAFYKKRLEPAI